MPDPKVSVIIPAYNEEECIEDCVDEVCEVLNRLGDTYEVIVVDDGSTDSTFEHLRTLKARHPQLRAIRFERNCGETAGWDAGFKHARGEFVVTVDADLQNDPADIPRMLALMNEWDGVGGVRAVRNDSLLRRISSRIANWVRNKLTHENVQDVGCSLRVVRAEYVKRVKLFKGMHRFMPTLLALEGCRITEIPVNHRPRPRGQSKYGVWNRLFRGLHDLFAVRWMISRHIDYKIKQEL